jgi:copper chaperone CopZ
VSVAPKTWLLLALLAAGAGGAWWVASTRSAPTYQPVSEEPVAFPPAPSVLLSAPGPAEVVRSFDLEGMCCRGCTGKLHRALMACEGVREAAVDLHSATAQVIVRSDLPVERLELALNFGKYTAHARP